MLREIPPVEYGFLEELLLILGKPNEIFLRVHEKESTLDNILIEESYSVRKCECDPETILRLYKEFLKGRGKRRDVSVNSLKWSESEVSPTFKNVLSAKFTPYEFTLDINIGKNKEKFNKLVGLISRYKIINKIRII